MKHKASAKIWKQSLDVFPGGVNSPVRAFGSVGETPIAIASGEGAYVTDEDGNRYLDFVNSWGPLILGHAHKEVTKAIREQAKLGTSYGAVTKNELELGQYILKHVPHIDMLRFVNSGTEAVMTALRLARGYTGRNRIIKFDGCYHGHSDSMLVKAGSGLLTMSGDISEASSPGIPAEMAQLTINLPLDDEDSLAKAFATYGNEIAAVIIEPLPANAGLLPQRFDFLKKVKDTAKEHGALFIMDEVITGFRLGVSGFAGKYFLNPDLVTYGKIIGGGLPVGAIGGKREVMQQLAPAGPVYQAGTLSGNPLAMAAGLAMLKTMIENKVYDKLDSLASYLQKRFAHIVKPALQSTWFDIQLVQKSSIFWMNFHEQGKENVHVHRVSDIWEKSAFIYGFIFRTLLNRGISLAPSAYEVGFLSAAMKKSDIDFFLTELARAISKVPSQEEIAES